MKTSDETKLINLLLHKKFKRFFWAVLVIVAVALIQNYWTGTTTNSAQIEANLVTAGYFPVERVVDGDTFVYIENGTSKTVRLLGVDTPETKDPRKPVQCFGKEASDETTSLIAGKTVRLESDPKAQNLDKYQRELRYVYLPDGRMLNRILVAEGYAHATPEYPFSLSAEFVNLEKEATIAGKGLWNTSVCN